MSENGRIKTSYVGTFEPESYFENRGEGIAYATLLLGDGTRKTIEGRNNGARENGVRLLREAVENRCETIVLGTIPRNTKNPPMAIDGIGPIPIDGIVRFVRHSDPDFNPSWVTAMVETVGADGDKKRHIITGYSDFVSELDGMNDGDRLQVNARPCWERIKDSDKYEAILRMTAPGKFMPVLENTVSEEATDNSPSP